MAAPSSPLQPPEPAALLNAIRAGSLDSVRALLDTNPALIETRDASGASALLLAYYHGKADIAAELVSRHPGIDFFEACAAGDEIRMRALVDQDSSLLRAVSPDGFPGLGLAVFFGHESLARELGRRGADVNQAATNALGVAPIHAAIARKNASLAAFLISHGADVNARQASGFTALHGAAYNGDWDSTRLLLAAGAQLDAVTADGKTAADLAAAKGHGDLAAWLRGEERI